MSKVKYLYDPEKLAKVKEKLLTAIPAIQPIKMEEVRIKK